MSYLNSWLERVIGVIFEGAQSGTVYLADPLAGQTKPVSDLCAFVAIEVNRKKYHLRPGIENFSGQIYQFEPILMDEELYLRITPVAREQFKKRRLHLTVWPLPLSITRHEPQFVPMVRAVEPLPRIPKCVNCFVMSDLDCQALPCGLKTLRRVLDERDKCFTENVISAYSASLQNSLYATCAVCLTRFNTRAGLSRMPREKGLLDHSVHDVEDLLEAFPVSR